MENDIFLPTDEMEFEFLIDALMSAYPKFKNRDHVCAVVANRIQHLPPTEDKSTLQYFGSCINKNMAYQVADHVGKKINHKMFVDQQISLLTSNPDDQQARDQLEKAINGGSEYAKSELEKFSGSITGQLLHMVPPSQNEEKSGA